MVELTVINDGDCLSGEEVTGRLLVVIKVRVST